MATTTAEKLIKERVVWSVGAGLVPVPLLDFVAVTAIQRDLIRELCTHYKVDYSDANGRMWVGALTGSALASFGASVIKAIPGIGSVIGALSMSITAGASTWAVGQVVNKHLAAGGTLADLDVDAARRQYDAEYERGKEVAKEASRNPAAKEVFEQLEKLGELKAKGVLTEAEFEAKKAELLARL